MDCVELYWLSHLLEKIHSSLSVNDKNASVSINDYKDSISIIIDVKKNNRPMSK